jgi:N-acyl amino acid synthase of PEP-CTERM/exosortase system
VAAYLAATSLTEITGMTMAFAMMEPFLPRLLAKSGIDFEKVGGEVDYHGLRAPYFSTTDKAIKGMLPNLRGLYEAIYPVVNSGYQASVVNR